MRLETTRRSVTQNAATTVYVEADAEQVWLGGSWLRSQRLPSPSIALRVSSTPTTGIHSYRTMLIALLKRLAVPVPIIAVLGGALIKLKRKRQEKHGSQA
jgi:hypothetical protein